jgi:uncharacterized protein YndB with AHSA1/START domain
MRTAISAFLIVWATAFAGPAAAAPSSDIDVKVQIVDGEVLTSASFFVPAPRERVWEVVTDYEHTPQYMPDVQMAKIISRSGNTLRLMQKDEVKFGPFSIPIETVRDVKHIEPSRTESHIVSGAFKKYDAKMELVSEAGGTRVTYRAQVIPDSALAVFAGESTIRKHTAERFGEIRAEVMRRERVATASASG